jgi:hypothetical protein
MAENRLLIFSVFNNERGIDKEISFFASKNSRKIYKENF